MSYAYGVFANTLFHVFIIFLANYILKFYKNLERRDLQMKEATHFEKKNGNTTTFNYILCRFFDVKRTAKKQ